jgi:hypothetical protein
MTKVRSFLTALPDELPLTANFPEYGFSLSNPQTRW